MKLKFIAVATTAALVSMMVAGVASATSAYDGNMRVTSSLKVLTLGQCGNTVATDITQNWSSYLTDISTKNPNISDAAFNAMSASFRQAEATGSVAVVAQNESWNGSQNEGVDVFWDTQSKLSLDWTSSYTSGWTAVSAVAGAHTYAASITDGCPDGVCSCIQYNHPAAGAQVDTNGNLVPVSQGSEMFVSTAPPSSANAYMDFQLFYFNGNANYPSGYAGPTVTQTSGAPGSTSNYVAMGDSFSSGEGNSPFYPDTATSNGSNKCDRSYVAYSQLLPSKLAGLTAPTFVACSGAITYDLFNSTNSKNTVPGPNGTSVPVPAQLTAADLSASTKLVTLTIGGNDLGFPDVFNSCVTKPPLYADPHCQSKSPANLVPGELAALAGPETTDWSPSSTLAEGTNVPIYSWKTVLGRIHELAPNATIAVAGYPQLIDPSGSGWSRPGGSLKNRAVCQIGTVTGVPLVSEAPLLIDKSDAEWIYQTIATVDTLLRYEVQTSGIPGVVYVDPSKTFGTTHALCDDTPWINAIQGSISSTWPLLSIWPGSSHPNLDGQSLGYANAFASALPSSF